MLRPLQSAEVADSEWLAPFVSDFRTRFMTLLAGAGVAVYGGAVRVRQDRQAGRAAGVARVL
jgi:hypothetical protein